MMRNSKLLKAFSLLSIVLTLLFATILPASAAVIAVKGSDNGQVVRYNENTRYQATVLDSANLMSELERQYLADSMANITDFAHITVVTVERNSMSAAAYAQQLNLQFAGSDTVNSIMVLVDMDNREFIIDSLGKAATVITGNVADTIADNCYRLFSAHEYCAGLTRLTGQIYTKLSGAKIEQPVKYISNALLAVVIGCTLAYAIARLGYLVKKRTVKCEPFRFRINTDKWTNDKNAQLLWSPEIEYTRTRRVYTGGSGGSGGGHGGGHRGGGGGHHSSGGHRF